MYGDVHALCKHIYPACSTDAQGTVGAQVNTNKAAHLSKNHVTKLLWLFNSYIVCSKIWHHFNAQGVHILSSMPVFQPHLSCLSFSYPIRGYLVSLRTDLLGLQGLEYHLKILFQSKVNGSYPLVRCRKRSVVISGSATVQNREQIQVLTKGEWQRQSNESEAALEGTSF